MQKSSDDHKARGGLSGGPLVKELFFGFPKWIYIFAPIKNYSEFNLIKYFKNKHVDNTSVMNSFDKYFSVFAFISSQITKKNCRKGTLDFFRFFSSF